MKNLTYQQIQKVINDCTELIDLYNTEINILSNRINNIRKNLYLFKRKKKIYEKFLKESKVDFTSDCDFLDDISDVF